MTRVLFDCNLYGKCHGSCIDKILDNISVFYGLATLLHSGHFSKNTEHMEDRKSGCIAEKTCKDIPAELHADTVEASQIAVAGTKQGNVRQIPVGKLLGSSFALI